MERGEPGRTGKRTHEAESGKGERTRSAGTPEMENGAGAEGKGRMPGWNTRHGTPEALPHEAAPDKGGINPQIRRVRRFRIRNGVPCRKQPQDTGRAWRTLRMAGEGCQPQNVDSASCITATFCI